MTICFIIAAKFFLRISLLSSHVAGWSRGEQGVVIRDFRKIARNYLRGWFLPDFLGYASSMHTMHTSEYWPALY